MIEVLAESRAARNGDLARFRIERNGVCDLFGSTSTYEIYMMEAEDMLLRDFGDIRALVTAEPYERSEEDWNALYEMAGSFD